MKRTGTLLFTLLSLLGPAITSRLHAQTSVTTTFESFTPGVGRLYTTPFTGFSGYTAGLELYDDGSDDPIQGILATSPLGSGKAAYLGGAGTNLTLWPAPSHLEVGIYGGLPDDPVLNLSGSADPVFRTSLDFVIQRNGGTNQQGFNFYAFDARDQADSETATFHSYVRIEPDNRITIADNLTDLEAADFVFTDTGHSIRPGVAYHLDYAINYATSRWSATLTSLDGTERFRVAIGRPTNSANYTLSGWTTPTGIANIEMSAMASAANASFADRIIFDNVSVAFERVAVKSVTISKEITRVQTSATTFDPNGADYGFYAEVGGQNIDLIAPPILTGPINESILGPTFHNAGRLVIAQDNDLDNGWNYGIDGDNSHLDSKTTSDAIFGTGAYTFTVNGVPLAITLPGDAYPNAPLLTLNGGAWSNGEYLIAVDQPLVLTTSTYTGYGTHIEDRIEMFMESDEDGPVLFNIERYASLSPAASMLTQTIPAGTLVAGQTYSAGAGFGAFVSKNATLPGVVAGAFYDASSDLRIRVVAPSAATAFAAYLSNAGVPEAQRATTADPDADGIPNLLEYALGLAPMTPGSTGLPLVQKTGTNLTLTYKRAVNDVTYSVQTTTTLATPASWTTTGVTQGTPAGDGTTTATIPLGSGPRFLRLQVMPSP